MSYQGDYATATSVVFNFNTASFSDGSPITLAGTPALSVYKNSTTESTAGVTLTVDYDSRTGMHHVVVDTSADGTFYAAGNDFDVVITTGTVGGTSVVGRVVGSFSLNNRSALRPATSGRTLVVDASGLADANTVKLGPTGSGTAQTARDIGASVLLSTGTGTGQLDFTSGVVKANATQWLGGTIPAVNVTGVPLVDAKYLLGTIFPTPTVAGIPNINVKTWNDLATVALPLVPTVAGRTLDVSAGGEAGVDWANVGTPGSTVSLSATTVNLVPTAPNLTNAPTAGDFTATMKTSLNAATPAVTVSDKTGFSLTAAYDFAKGTIAVTESYAANAAAPTPVQAMLAIHQMLMQFIISGTSYTVRKLDNSTTAFVVTLDSATAPTSAVRT